MPQAAWVQVEQWEQEEEEQPQAAEEEVEETAGFAAAAVEGEDSTDDDGDEEQGDEEAVAAEGSSPAPDWEQGGEDLEDTMSELSGALRFLLLQNTEACFVAADAAHGAQDAVAELRQVLWAGAGLCTVPSQHSHLAPNTRRRWMRGSPPWRRCCATSCTT